MPPIKPITVMFEDDGASVPNNPTLPALIYRQGIDLKGQIEPEKKFEQTFAANGWSHNIWRNGSIFPYVHYHSMSHEVMGIAWGRVRLRLGGSKGKEIDFAAGDVIVLPAGTGHQLVSQNSDLKVVGAYPPEGTYNLCRGSKDEHDKALKAIPNVPLPNSDPVLGKNGPLVELWRK